MNSRLMALSSKLIFRRSMRMFTTSASRFNKDEGFPDPLDLATGMEKKEMLARLNGNDDPYNLKAIKKGVGSKDKPTEIPSAFEARIVGCVCEEDSSHIKWMWLYSGEPKRCICGHWYKLIHKESFL
ncbi:cytochrome c oxidase subunit 5B, mitochondrial-like [Daktulosphaira vitifoliae]|uniref:cytochrome c oxidase subunit 5B, mitochondrial-like n=1 Tax=Daktulosphaira vitifoliae TaxID=58002 RepID=UPI0021A9A06B|nr:cytochrome c oxidase subunit 5B, mitochondrial-like [Daktulosphaira vitifoliae]